MSDKRSKDIAHLRGEERALVSALAEFDHEARRTRDQLERSGGHSIALETRLSQLKENMAVAKRDLDVVRANIASYRSDYGGPDKQESPA